MKYDDPEQLERLKRKISAAAYSVLLERMDEIKVMLEEATVKGCFDSGVKSRHGSLEVWFVSPEDKCLVKTLSLTHNQKRLERNEEVELESAILTLILNSEGFKPLRRTIRAKNADLL